MVHADIAARTSSSEPASADSSSTPRPSSNNNARSGRTDAFTDIMGEPSWSSGQSDFAGRARPATCTLQGDAGGCRRDAGAHHEAGDDRAQGARSSSAGAIAAGKLQIPRALNERVIYHDPCYLSRGVGVIEAPRGTLFHHYVVDGRGRIERVNLIVSSGQNNTAMNAAVPSESCPA